MRILIAEDDAASRLLLRRAIEQRGHDVLVTDDGEQAWALYRQHAVDVIVSDWLMPGCDGPELCRRVRSEQRETYTYFILLTALDDQQHFIEGMQAGADDYLIKPFDRVQLEVRLRVAERVTTLHRQLAEKTRELEQVNQALAETARRDPLTASGTGSSSARICSAPGLAPALRTRVRRRPLRRRPLQAVQRPLRPPRRRRRAEDGRPDHPMHHPLRRHGLSVGGEELLVIMPEQTAETSVIAMERIRDAIERLAISHPGNPPHDVLTISIGLITVGGGEQLPWETVLNQADEALYRAKARGRNQIALAEPNMLGLCT